jgi:hypothetical protein
MRKQGCTSSTVVRLLIVWSRAIQPVFIQSGKSRSKSRWVTCVLGDNENPRELNTPTPFTAADVITRGESGEVAYHYAIIEVGTQVALL